MTRDELQTILKIALDRGDYAGLQQPEPVWLSKHPITGEESRDMWLFHGAVGCTDGIDAFRRTILEELTGGDLLTRIVYHMIGQRGTDGWSIIGHNVVVEVETNVNEMLPTRHLVSGMTDYSGEGNSGFESMKAFTAVLADVYGVKAQTLYYTHPDIIAHLGQVVGEARKEGELEEA